MAAQEDLVGERNRFIIRAVMIVALLIGFMEYASRRPDGTGVSAAGTSEGSGARSCDDAEAGAPAGAEDRAADEETLRALREFAERSTGVEAAPEDAQAYAFAQDPAYQEKLREEASMGVLGSAGRRFLEKAEERGDLDRIRVHGKSLKQYMREAEDLSRRAEELSEESRRRMLEAHGLAPDADQEDPEKVVREMSRYLDEANPEPRLLAVQTLCDHRFAKKAEPLIPRLEKLAREDPNDEVREFAKLALKRAKFWRYKRRDR